jgi:hypothetical protein
MQKCKCPRNLGEIGRHSYLTRPCCHRSVQARVIPQRRDRSVPRLDFLLSGKASRLIGHPIGDGQHTSTSAVRKVAAYNVRKRPIANASVTLTGPASTEPVTVSTDQNGFYDFLAYPFQIGMFSSLLPAILNIMVGNDGSCVVETIEDAHAWMALYPLGSKA